MATITITILILLINPAVSIASEITVIGQRGKLKANDSQITHSHPTIFAPLPNFLRLNCHLLVDMDTNGSKRPSIFIMLSAYGTPFYVARLTGGNYAVIENGRWLMI